jgi:hypothetical protein
MNGSSYLGSRLFQMCVTLEGSCQLVLLLDGRLICFCFWRLYSLMEASKMSAISQLSQL